VYLLVKSGSNIFKFVVEARPVVGESLLDFFLNTFHFDFDLAIDFLVFASHICFNIAHDCRLELGQQGVDFLLHPDLVALDTTFNESPDIILKLLKLDFQPFQLAVGVFY